ncbi:MAG TPA: hypothetical protein VIL07_10615, partial [Symbiobacteriaceae bacterium]
MPARPYPTYPARGWPVTALLATAPAALLLGFVTGIVIATHTAAVPSTLPGSGAGNVDPASPPVGQPAPDEFWQIPDTERKTASMLPPITSGDPAGAPVTQPGSPSGVYFQGTPRDIREARLALLTDFRTYD